MLISELVNQFKNQAVLVVGDTYIDREIYGKVTRLAPEAPVPVVKVSAKRFLPGGAANVAKNITQLGGKALLHGAFGEDAQSREMAEWLRADSIQFPENKVSEACLLPERYRIFAANQQLIQLLKRAPAQMQGNAAPALGKFLGASGPVQAIVIYDQGYGFVTRELLQAVQDLRDQGVKVIVDAHPAHVAWYGGAHLVTFNAEECLEAAKNLGGAITTVIAAGSLLQENLNADILVTEGSEGLTLFQAGQPPARVPVVRVHLADRAGAGDSVTAVLALSLASGANLKTAAELANKAASIVVAKPGIAYVTPGELVNLFQHEIGGILMESAGVKQRLVEEQLPEIEALVKTIIRTYREDKKVYAFGNGGSAADANHLITELVGRFLIERKGLPALSFSANEILMTSIANDYGYENTFARQVDTFVREGDLVVAFSTSGKSPNVVKALQLARTKGATTVGFTGRAAGLFPALCDICLRVPSDSTPRIQESHLAVVHIICELLEKELAAKAEDSVISPRNRALIL
jgi:D-sedoheptulose 7-phosphate isomerase